MHSVLVLVLISILQFSLCFPAVAGDCFDDLPNNGSYDNCNTCYQTLANALINTKDNKYNLGQAFFPYNDVRPVQVTVEYLCTSASDTEDTNCTTIDSDNNCTTDTTWYWLRGEFFVYQPMDIFMYRSLFFSPPHWRKKSVKLYLPHQCFICSNNSDDFFGYLTQRLDLYASRQSATAHIPDTYAGRAIKASHPQLGDADVTGDVGRHIITAVYILPFSIICVLLILALCVYMRKHLRFCSFWDKLLEELEYKAMDGMKNFKSKLTKDLQVQGNLAAVTLICCIFTIYAFALDMVSVAEENSANLPQYFHRKSYGFYVITILFNLVSLLFDVIGILWFIVVWFYNVFLSYNFYRNKKWEVYFPMLLCIGSALLSLSFHFQNILIAWSTDPFYASRIALFYGIIIFCYFLCVKYAYSFPLKILRRNEGPQKSNHWNTCELITVVTSLFVTTGVCTGIIVIVTMFIIHVPINNSIEQSVTGVSTIFNGAVILIGGFVAYNVGLQYFGNLFSLEDALKNAMNEIKEDPFNKNSVENWKKLTEEKRMTEVMKELIQREASRDPKSKDPPSQPPPIELPSNSQTKPSTQPPSTSQTQPHSSSPTHNQEPPAQTGHHSASVTQSMIIENPNHSDEKSQSHDQPTPNQEVSAILS